MIRGDKYYARAGKDGDYERQRVKAMLGWGGESKKCSKKYGLWIGGGFCCGGAGKEIN